MFQAFIVTLRQGLEALLVVAALHTYLERTGKGHLFRSLRWGAAASLPLSVVAAFAMRRASNEALAQGLITLGAAGLAYALTWYVARAARAVRHGQYREHNAEFPTAPLAGVAVFVFTALMVTRAGAGTATVLLATVFQIKSLELSTAACAGVLAAAAIASAWILAARHVSLGRYFQVSMCFLVLFIAQLSVYGFHELTEAHVLPFSEPLHGATEPYAPDGRYGQYFPYLLVLGPLAGLAVFSLKEVSAGPVSDTTQRRKNESRNPESRSPRVTPTRNAR